MADASVIIILCSTQFTALSFFGFSSARGFIVGKCLEASSHCIISAHIRLLATFPLCHIVSYCIREKANIVVNLLYYDQSFPALPLSASNCLLMRLDSRSVTIAIDSMCTFPSATKSVIESVFFFNPFISLKR